MGKINSDRNGKVKKEYKDKITEETRYYLLSENYTAEELIYYTRNEWSVESMHWLLDVNLKEDTCRVTDENVQTNLNIIRKIILNTLKMYKNATNSKKALSKIMRKCLFDTEELEKLLTDTSLLEAFKILQ